MLFFFLSFFYLSPPFSSACASFNTLTINRQAERERERKDQLSKDITFTSIECTLPISLHLVYLMLDHCWYRATAKRTTLFDASGKSLGKIELARMQA